MNKDKALEFIQQYKDLLKYIEDNADNILKTITTAKSLAYKDTGSSYSLYGNYTFDGLEIDSEELDLEKIYVVYESYHHGEDNHIYVSLLDFFDVNLFEKTYTEKHKEILEWREKEKLQQEAKVKASADREIKILVNLAKKYPGELDAIQRDLSNAS